MTEITFLDGLDYCDVHGHCPEHIDDYVIDIVGTRCFVEKCTKCGKIRKSTITRTALRTINTFYPNGEWA